MNHGIKDKNKDDMNAVRLRHCIFIAKACCSPLH